MDLKMASLISYIHPELQELYPLLDFTELDPKLVFGMSIPETKEEILTRIDTQPETIILSEYPENDDIREFTEAVNSIQIPNSSLEQ